VSSLNPSLIAFYMGLLVLATGAIRFARSTLERKRPDPFAFVLAGAGALFLIAALYFYVNAPPASGLHRP